MLHCTHDRDLHTCHVTQPHGAACNSTLQSCGKPSHGQPYVQVLPDYLRYEIRCGEAQRQRLMGRIMEALACWAPGMQTAA